MAHPGVGGVSESEGAAPGLKILENTTDVFMAREGLGDLIFGAAIAKGVQAESPGERVRLVVSHYKTKMEWAALCWNDVDVKTSSLRGARCLYPWRGFEQADTAAEDEAYPNDFKLDILARQVGVKAQRIDFNVTTADVERAQGMVDSARRAHAKKVVLICPFSTEPTRNWPYHRWLEIVNLFERENVFCYVSPYSVYITGVRGAPVHYDCFTPPLSIGELTALVNAVDLVVGPDTGPLHIAGMLGKPGLALCGYTSGHKVFGWYESIKFIQAPAVCTMCFRKPARGFRSSCFMGCEALYALPVKPVMDTMRSMLNR